MNDEEELGPRPDLIQKAGSKLSRIEQFNIRAIRRGLDPGPVDDTIKVLQQRVGARWINLATSRLLRVHGMDRVPPFASMKSFVLVANHRSFFDLFVTTSELVRRGLSQRIVFPVRSGFFYDHPLGIVVNGAMSFLSMYPPVFRDRQRAALNIVGLDELIWLLRRGGTFVGIHPEGKRNTGPDPYALLPAQSGVGRIIHQARVPVVPAFINGLRADNLPKQILGNFDGSGDRINVVFGQPIDFGDLLDRPKSPRVFKAIAERSLDIVRELGEEERALRAANADASGGDSAHSSS